MYYKLIVFTNLVTHEVARGSIDEKQMQALMARGLSEEEAINVIVKGILR